jgi:hypothetical protein
MPKISELNPLSSLSNDDLVPVVNDPNGSPSNNKVTFNNFANSVIKYFNDRNILTGNVTFLDTTISTKYTGQDLTLDPQGSNVYIGTDKNLVVSNIVNDNDISISANNDLVWNFSTEGALTLTSTEYGNVIGFGYGMGPTIESEDSLFVYSQYSNTITSESWAEGTLSYSGTYQAWTEYSNSESNSYRNTGVILNSFQNEQMIALSISDGSNVNNRYWEFDKNGNINLPDGGIISDSFPIYKARALEAYDQITWNSTTITFDNASSFELRNVLALLQAGDRISFDDFETTVVTPYTGGTDGTIIVNGNYSIADVQLFELPDRRNLIDGIRLKTNNGNANTWTFGIDGALTLPRSSVISETSSTLVLTPPNALAGQSLVIRPTVGSFSLSTDHPDGFVPGASITITTNNIIGNGAGTLNYEFSGATSVQLGRATTGILTFESSDTTKDLTWTIPSLSSMTTFTFTLTGGTGFGGINGLPISITVTLDGSAVTENNHLHLTSGNTTTTDLYLGDDNLYVKVEKNSGNIVIGTSTNTKQWTFDTNGILSLPANAEIGSESPFNITNAKTITTNNIVIDDNIYDDLHRPLFNPNALDINADGGTSISVFAVRDKSFTGGGSRTVYGKYEAALDGGFSYNNRHSSNFIDGGGSNQI